MTCTTLLLSGTFLAAAIDWLAVYQGRRRLEYFAKPITMVALFAYLIKAGGLDGALLWFGLGVLLSLAGDVFLMLPERWFLAGLAAFLLAHVAYIVGFNLPVPTPSPYALALAVLYAVMVARIYPRIAAGLAAGGRTNLRTPVLAYTVVITIMLLSATLTLFRPEWESTGALLAFLGAALFFLSDLILALDRFVNPIRHGRVINMVAYHLGQIALIVGVVQQFG